MPRVETRRVPSASVTSVSCPRASRKQTRVRGTRLVSPHAVERPVERRVELLGPHGLEEVGDGVHVVAVERVVDDAGHEHDLRALAAGTQLAGEGHAV